MALKDKPTVEVTYNGIGFGGLLTILFIGLKLTGYIDWEWLWVLAPLWVPFLFFLSLILLVGAGVFLYGFLEVFYNHFFKRKKQ